MTENITYLGLDKLDTFEANLLKQLCEKNFTKILRDLNKFQEINLNATLKVNIKTINSEGKQKNYLINANVTSTTGNFNVEESDWDLARTTHKVFDNFSNLINHKLKLK